MLGACAKELGVKVYISDPQRGGLYRGQENELIKWIDSSGYYCVNTQDMRKLVETYRACKDLPSDGK